LVNSFAALSRLVESASWAISLFASPSGPPVSHFIFLLYLKKKLPALPQGIYNLPVDNF
jgi:hypothetical protein